MSDIIKIGGVRGYVDKDGMAWLNAEDVAKGFGFTDVREGKEYVRWARVNDYLNSFGFSPQVAKDDFIPENMVYRLGFKANNEVAQGFQAKLADEILPTIRKTGSYTVKPMSQLEIMAESIRILQEQDKRLKQVELAQAEQKKELQDIREIVTLRPDSWRDDTKTILDKIAIALGGDSEAFRDIRKQSYTELEKRAHCRLGVQLKNAQKRMEEQGASKTQIKQLRILDMIDKNQRLIEIYLSVVKDMAIHHGVSVDDMLF
jgi:prophage antirepressor-like protein